MIASYALDASRNWTTPLSRFGFGVIILTTLLNFWMLPSSLDISNMKETDGTWEALPLIIFWIMISMVLGAMAIMLGSVGPTSRFGEQAKANRAYRVGQSGNPLLAEFLRDANARYDLASGFVGVGSILIVLLIAGSITGLVKPVELQGGQVASSHRWVIIAVYNAIGMLSSYLLRRSATNGIEAIDKVLDQHFPLE